MNKSRSLLNRLFICLLLFFVIIISVSCKRKGTDRAVVINVIGSVTVEHLSEKVKSVKSIELKEILKKGDIVTVGDKSQLTVLIGGEIVLKFNPKSIVEISKLFEKGENEFNLKNGKILTKFDRLRKDTTCLIKTPTTIAGVRGTEFSISYYDAESIVAVKRGEVSVERLGADEKKSIKEGETAIVTDKISIRPISEIELLEIDKVSIVEMIDDPEGLSETEFDEINNDIKLKEEEIDKKIKEILGKTIPSSLKEVKEKFGRVDLVVLYNGKQYKGVILSRGEKFTILTTKGKVKVNSKDIEQTKVIR